MRVLLIICCTILTTSCSSGVEEPGITNAINSCVPNGGIVRIAPIGDFVSSACYIAECKNGLTIQQTTDCMK
jgi:hypothetical protein